jgi:hypothetical protein
VHPYLSAAGCMLLALATAHAATCLWLQKRRPRTGYAPGDGVMAPPHYTSQAGGAVHSSQQLVMHHHSMSTGAPFVPRRNPLCRRMPGGAFTYGDLAATGAIVAQMLWMLLHWAINPRMRTDVIHTGMPIPVKRLA